MGRSIRTRIGRLKSLPENEAALEAGEISDSLRMQGFNYEAQKELFRRLGNISADEFETLMQLADDATSNPHKYTAPSGLRVVIDPAPGLDGPTHFAASGPFCKGGRNDTADWGRVDCPLCLRGLPTSKRRG
jgi:hypothetical protein